MPDEGDELRGPLAGGCSRMFGKRLYDLPPICEATATYAVRACEKLRAQGSYCKRV